MSAKMARFLLLLLSFSAESLGDGDLPEFYDAGEPTLLDEMLYPDENETRQGDCVFFDWFKWSPCTATCGGGMKTRDRLMNPYRSRLTSENETVCPTFTSERRACGVEPCVIDCVVSSWSSWGLCDCTLGLQERLRAVLEEANHGGHSCPYLNESRNCTDRSACVQECVTGQWSEWGECSASCGEGVWRGRSRSVGSSVATTGPCAPVSERLPCPLLPCPLPLSLCKEKKDGVYGDPQHMCSSRFLSCDNQEEKWQTCPVHLSFSPPRQRCIHPSANPECQSAFVRAETGMRSGLSQARRRATGKLPIKSPKTPWYDYISGRKASGWSMTRTVSVVGVFVLLLLIVICLSRIALWDTSPCPPANFSRSP